MVARLHLVIAFFCVGSVASAQTPCPDLRNLDSESFPVPTRILSAALVTVPAAGLPSPLPMSASKLPIEPYCAVTGYVAPQHQFEMRMPVPAQWNGKFFYAACAGLCGGVSGNACNQGLLLAAADRTIAWPSSSCVTWRSRNRRVR